MDCVKSEPELRLKVLTRESGEVKTTDSSPQTMWKISMEAELRSKSVAVRVD